MSVRIHVHAAARAGLASAKRVRAIGQNRARAERDLFKQAKSDLAGITDALLIELENRLRAKLDAFVGAVKSKLRMSGFLATAQLPKPTPVRVVAADVPYPTVISLVQDHGFTVRASLVDNNYL